MVGQLISTQVVFGQEVRLRTRYLYFCILNRSSWNSFLSLSSEAVGELEFCFKNLDAMNKRGICLSQLTEESNVQILIYCDASDTGYGCHLTNNLVDEQVLACYGFWNGWERKQSSTWRELEAIKRV